MNLKSCLSFAGVLFAAVSLAQSAKTTLNAIDVPPVVSSAQDLGPTDPNKVLNVTIGLPFGDPIGIQKFVDNVSNPYSPYYRQFITPDEVGTRFGLSLDAIYALENYFKQYGFRFTYVNKSHLTASAQCTVAQAQQAFSTEIHNFKSVNVNEQENPNFYSYTKPLSVDPSIAPYVVSVSGLQNYTKPHATVLTPQQEQTLYGISGFFNSGYTGAGRTIGISNWDGFRLSNVPLFYQKFNLPAPAAGVGSNITVIPIGGGSGGGTASGEGDLDIQIALASAPLCHLIVYDGDPSAGNVAVLSQEANDNLADVLSESYGWNLSPSESVTSHNLHLQMNAQGMTYMVATGDSGTAGLKGPFKYSDYEPEVLLVGGTVPTVTVGGNRVTEVGWADGGGGWTLYDAPFNVRPSWQVGTGVPAINKRLVPDVAEAGDGSGNTGAVYIFLGGSLAQISGTSVSSPMFTGQLAIAEQHAIDIGVLGPNSAGKYRLGRINDLLYKLQGTSAFFDVTSGNNGTLPNGDASTAHVGWDTVTGLGAINWGKIDLSVISKLAVGAQFIAVDEGTGLNGSGNALYNDGVYFRINPTSIPGLGKIGSAAYSFNLPSTVSRDWLLSIDFRVIDRFADRSTGQLYLLNWSTGKWDIIKAYPLNGTTATDTTVSLSSSFSTYVSAAGEVRMLVRGILPATVGVSNNSFDTDYLTSTFTYKKINK